MPKIVLTTDKLSLPATAKPGEIISVHDDDVELTGAGYENMEILQVNGVTLVELRAVLDGLRPEQKTATRISAMGKWCFVEEKQVWKNGEVWCDVKTQPKYGVSLAGLAVADKETLADSKNTLVGLQTALTKAKSTLELYQDNLTEVPDLNA
jgi:hypothetical protein